MAEEAPRRPMKFPYTFSAKIAQFPLKFYIQNQWIWKYYLVGLAISLPVFYKIHKLCKLKLIIFFRTKNSNYYIFLQQTLLKMLLSGLIYIERKLPSTTKFFGSIQIYLMKKIVF